MAESTWDVSESVREITEVCHGVPLFPRETYTTVLLAKRVTFNPLDYEADYKVAFRRVLEFWVEKHLESGTILEYTVVKDSRDKQRAVSAIVETFYGTQVRKILRRVHSFEGVLDLHVDLANDFQQLHGNVKVWFD